MAGVAAEGRLCMDWRCCRRAEDCERSSGTGGVWLLGRASEVWLVEKAPGLKSREEAEDSVGMGWRRCEGSWVPSGWVTVCEDEAEEAMGCSGRAIGSSWAGAGGGEGVLSSSGLAMRRPPSDWDRLMSPLMVALGRGSQDTGGNGGNEDCGGQPGLGWWAWARGGGASRWAVVCGGGYVSNGGDIQALGLLWGEQAGRWSWARPAERGVGLQPVCLALGVGCRSQAWRARSDLVVWEASAP